MFFSLASVPVPHFGVAMENEPTNASAHSEDSAEQKTKKPYSRPAFQYEKVFETMALACGKIGTVGPCGLNSKNS